MRLEVNAPLGGQNDIFKKIQQALTLQAIDALLLHDRQSKRYVSALPGSGVYVVVTLTQAPQFHDRLYRNEAADTSGFTNIEIPQGEYLPELVSFLSPQLYRRVALVSTGFPIPEFQTLTAQDWTSSLADSLLAKSRTVKDAVEIQAITATCRVTDQIFAHLLPHIRAGVSEYELNAWLHFYALQTGASAMAFDPIVASGPRGALPHMVGRLPAALKTANSSQLILVLSLTIISRT